RAAARSARATWSTTQHFRASTSTRRPTRCAPTASGSRASPRVCFRWRSGIFSSDGLWHRAYARAARWWGRGPATHAVRRRQLAGLARDRLVLSAEERRWGRRRVKTANGRELALALPTGTVLTPGHVLYVGPEYYVVIEAAEELVLVVTPRSRDEAIRVAFEV